MLLRPQHTSLYYAGRVEVSQGLLALSPGARTGHALNADRGSSCVEPAEPGRRLPSAAFGDVLVPVSVLSHSRRRWELRAELLNTSNKLTACWRSRHSAMRLVKVVVTSVVGTAIDCCSSVSRRGLVSLPQLVVASSTSQLCAHAPTHTRFSVFSNSRVWQGILPRAFTRPHLSPLRS